MAGFSYQTVWRLAGPNIVSNILMVSISFAHLWIVAPLGPEMSAAVVAGGRVHFLLMAASMALSVATTAVVARAWGADDAHETSASTASSLALAVMISIFLGATTYFAAPYLVKMFSLDGKTASLAVDYIQPAALLNIVFALMLTIATAFRAIGDVLRPLRYMAVGAGAAIFLSYTLVRGAFGAPAVGIAGIPWGTAAGQALIVVWFLINWLRGRYVFRPHLAGALKRRRIGQLVRIGAPAAIEQVLIQMSFLLFMMLISGYGTAAFAAYGIGITILSITIVVGLGFGTASATLSGQLIGAEKHDEAVASGWAAMRLAMVGMCALAVITYAFKTPLANILSADPVVRADTEFFILILALIQPLMAIEFAIGGALRGAGDTRYPLFVTFCGMIVGRLSVGFAVQALGGPVEAMYSVIVGDYAIKAALLVRRFRNIDWREMELHPHAPIALQSVAGISRGPVRSFFGRRKTAEEQPE